MTAVSVRYIVDDVDAAVDFYRDALEFEIERRPAPGFAMLVRDGVQLLLSDPAGPGGAAQPMPDGRRPEPGGWNRIRIEVNELGARVEELRSGGAQFRGDIVHGRGGDQILLEDPSGNPVELFQPAR